MAISIISNSAEIRIVTRPRVLPPVINLADVSFPSSRILCGGSVNFSGAAGDNTAGWLVGWIQAQWIETSWGYYRGQTSNHGSEFHQRARPPARPGQACRDTLGPASDIFYDTGFGLRAPLPGGAAFPRTVNVEFHDTPSEGYAISVNNALTQQPNFLREVQLELHFAPSSGGKDPSGVFHQLKHIYWNLRWQYRFTPTAFPPGGRR